MRLFYSPLFVLSVFILISQVVNAKPASLIFKESFGSDPYKNIAYLNGNLLVSGKIGAGSPENSNLVDLLSYSDSGFSLLKQYQFDELQSGFVSSEVYDVMTVNDHFIILSNGSGLHGRSATVLDRELNIVDEAKLSSGLDQPIFSQGENNRFYAFGYDYNNPDKGIKVITVRVDNNGEFEVLDTSLLGASIQTSPSYRNTRFTATYHDNALYLVSNEKAGKAQFFKVTLDDQGVPMATQALDFPSAEAEYRTLAVRGNYLYASYVFWGFQVLKLEEDSLTEVFIYDENSQFVDFKFIDNHLFATDTFSTIEVFDVSDPENVFHNTKLNTDGFLSDGIIVNSELIVTQDWYGLGSYKIESDYTLTANHHFSQSGEASDFSFANNQLAVASLNQNFHLWTLGDVNTELTSNVFMFRGVDSIVYLDENLLIQQSGNIYKHKIITLQNGIDDGIYLDNIGTSGSSNNKMDLINGGFYTISGNTLAFFNKNSLLTSSLKLDKTSNFWGSEQYPISDGNTLYLPSNDPGRVTIFDATDLENVKQVAQIERENKWMYGNVAKVSNYLLIPDVKKIIKDSVETTSNVISVYDVSAISAPIFIKNISLQEYYSNEITLHIHENYLVILTSRDALLYQIDNVLEPILIDTTLNIPSSRIAQMFGNEIFSVLKNTSGHIQRSSINYAPSLEYISTNLLEDETSLISYVTEDRENDDITLSIEGMSDNVIVEIIENQQLQIVPVENENGIATVEIKAADIHGNYSQITATITIQSVNDLPEIITSIIDTNEDNELNVQIEAIDVESESLSFSMFTLPDYGIASITQEGFFTYLNTANFFGEDSVEIRVEDGSGGTALRTIRINVLPINDTPFLSSQTNAVGDEDSQITLDLAATDLDGNDVVFALVNVPDNWTVTLEGTYLNISPEADANGDFIITLSISDGIDTIEQELQIQVVPVNDPPALANQIVSQSTTEGLTLSGNINASDVDGDTLTYTLKTEAEKGSVTLSESGSYVYTPNTGSLGSDSFEITASDSLGAFVLVKVNVSITVKPEPTSDSSGGGSFSTFLILILLFRVFFNQLNFSERWTMN